jgi:opacity protein-like surface antigen
MKRLLYGCLVLVAVLGAGETARAAQRSYVWTEEYGTLAKGNAEVEFWQTAVTHDIQTRNASDWNQQLELEYGITDRLNVALYNVYEQTVDSSALTYLGYKLEVKYRVAEKDVLPVDVQLYAEEEVSTVEGNVFEGKLILGKDIGKLNITYNQIYERPTSTGKGENGYAFGISYEIVPAFRFGVESKGSYTEKEYAAGPTLAWIGNRIWADIGAVYGLNKDTNDREVRFMLGIPF